MTKVVSLRLFAELHEEGIDRKERKNITTEEIEFQKQKKECTFKPNLIARRGRSQIGMQRRVEVKGVEDMVARYRLAKEWKNHDENAINTGRHVNEGPVIET